MEVEFSADNLNIFLRDTVNCGEKSFQFGSCVRVCPSPKFAAALIASSE